MDMWKPYTLAARLVGLVAVLHLMIAVAALGDGAARLLVAAAVFGGLALALRGGRRWSVWLAFFACAFGISAAIGGAVSSVGLVSVLQWITVGTEVIAAASLFAILWAPKPNRDHRR